MTKLKPLQARSVLYADTHLRTWEIGSISLRTPLGIPFWVHGLAEKVNERPKLRLALSVFP